MVDFEGSCLGRWHEHLFHDGIVDQESRSREPKKALKGSPGSCRSVAVQMKIRHYATFTAMHVEKVTSVTSEKMILAPPNFPAHASKLN